VGIGPRAAPRIFRQIADAITSEYAPEDAADFLREEGIPPAAMDLPAGTGHGDVSAILSALWAWGAEGRRRTRRFIGRWLDDRLDIGPDPELRARLVVLRYCADLRVEQVAGVLGCSPGNVKSQSARALDKLRAVLGDAVTEPGARQRPPEDRSKARETIGWARRAQPDMMTLSMLHAIRSLQTFYTTGSSVSRSSAVSMPTRQTDRLTILVRSTRSR
jgi:hypothetical protein